MVRWKKSRRSPQRQNLEDLENSEEGNDSEDEENAMNDGEEEDNYRDPLIRLAYIPVVILAIVYSPLVLPAILVVEVSVYANKESRNLQQEQRMNAGLRSPPMEKILEDRSRFRQEIRFLKTCNLQLTTATWVNVMLELSSLVYSLLLLSIQKRAIYPTIHLFCYWFTRINNVYSEVYGRFFAPEDILGGLIAELIHDLVTKYSFNFSNIFNDYIPLVPCQLEFLVFPIVLSCLQAFTTQKHSAVYESERQMRKQVRERFLRDGPLHCYANIRIFSKEIS